MEKVGTYEILEDLYLTEHGSVSRARRADGERGLFAVKCFGMPVDDPSEPHWELQTFLDRARVQQMLAAGGARHWAPIHELGIDDDWAYYATDYHPLSAQKLIEGRFSLKSKGLHTLVLGVTQGLSELKALRNRAHGNLKPANILIGGHDLPTSTILLTDPASNGQAGKIGEAGDLKALGELIHELVVHRPAPDDEWPLPPAVEWGELGARAERWRRLCSDLLNPDPALRPKLPAVAQRLHALRSRGKLRFRKFFAVAAVLATAAVMAISVLSVLDYIAREKFRQSEREWFSKFVAAAADPKRSEQWQKDPDLKRILARIPPADRLRAIDSPSRWPVRWKYDQYVAVQAANENVAYLQSELINHWKLVNRADELRKRLEARGWAQPAEYLANLVSATNPVPGSDVGGAIDRLLNAAPNIEKGLALADSDWKRFVEHIDLIEANSDPVLSALAGVLRQSASSEVRLTNDGFTGLDEVKRDAAVAERLTKVLVETFPVNVDRQYFDREVAAQINLKKPKKEDAGKWLQLVARHAYRHEEAKAAAVDLRVEAQKAIDQVTHAHTTEDERIPFETAKHELSDAIADFEQTKFTQRTIDNKTFDQQLAQIRTRIAAIHKFYHPEGPEEWLNSLSPVATTSDAINARWKAWKDVLHDDLPQMLANRAIFKERQKASERLLTLLVSLDRGFPPVPPIANQAYMSLARVRREQALEKLLPLINLSAPTLPAEQLESAKDKFTQWSTNVVVLSRDFPIKKEIIGPDDHVDEKWKDKAEFWLDPAVQALVKDDVARLGRINALDLAPREQLVKALTGGGDAEIALAAWRLLGSAKIRPPWPTGRTELTDEFNFRKRVSAAFKLLKDPMEAESPARELADEAPIRWRRFVENSTSAEMVQKAWSLAPAFGADKAELAKLTPVARYNLSLGCLNVAIESGDDEAVRADLAALSVAAAALKDRPPVAQLPARIAKVARKEPFDDQKPGDLFPLTLPGATKPVQFKRVEPPGARPFYLCTTEVSVGQFIAALDATHAWPQAKQLAWPCEYGKPDTRRGPRAWDWGGTTEAPMTIPQLWLAPEDYNDYPAVFRAGRFNRTALSEAVGGNPSPNHPVQYISAQMALFYAGLCDCRLPTPAEWGSAYTAFEKANPVDHWNLRDQTWEQQRRYVATGAGTRWPDEEIFPAGLTTANVARNASARPGTDGILYFQSVDAPRGEVFRHLVGNVAQFVCDASETFETAANRKTAAGIRKFIEETPKSLYVIGGSALSPPDVALDKPLPVTRSDDAYADVGIRLAFTAPSRTLAEKVKWAIGEPRIFWPKPVVSAGK